MNARTQDRREKILEAARLLFSEKGFSGSSMRKIAEKAGVSLGNLYNHFNSKEEIFHQLLEPARILTSLKDLPEILQAGFPSNLDQVILKLKQVVDENMDLYRLIFIDFIEFNGFNTNRIIGDIIKLGRKTFEEKVENQNLVGPVLRPLDYELGIKGFVVAVMSFLVISKTVPAADISNYSDEELSQTISDYFLRGILA